MNEHLPEKRCLNVHVTEAEHAWLESFANREGLSLTMAFRTLVREHMRRELAADGIRAGLRCSWQDCSARPEKDGGDRPDLCRAHKEEAAKLEKERRKRSIKERRAARRRGDAT